MKISNGVFLPLNHNESYLTLVTYVAVVSAWKYLFCGSCGGEKRERRTSEQATNEEHLHHRSAPHTTHGLYKYVCKSKFSVNTCTLSDKVGAIDSSYLWYSRSQRLSNVKNSKFPYWSLNQKLV